MIIGNLLPFSLDKDLGHVFIKFYVYVFIKFIKNYTGL